MSETAKTSMGTSLILGATSGIARAVAGAMANGGFDLILAGRDIPELDAIAQDLRVRHGVQVAVQPFDALAFDGHEQFFKECVDQASGQSLAGLAGVILCHGFMAEQADAQNDFALCRQMVDANFTSAVSILNRAANFFEPKGSGFIAAISSVAGDRGRQSNYLYGSTKAALTTYLGGLRARMFKVGVSVLTIKPGFVDTAMTFGRPGMFLVASPDKVANDIFRAIQKRKDSIYTPWFWWGIMTIIKSVPEFIFKRTKM